MAELIQMRQRIKVVETIRKITHAMRLISMSTHSRLRSKKEALESYKQEAERLFKENYPLVPDWRHDVLMPQPENSNGSLIIIIGSQKGLAGPFNTSLMLFFDREIRGINPPDPHFVTVGKKIADYIQGTPYAPQTIMRFNQLTGTTYGDIAHAIAAHILTTDRPYRSVMIFSNYPRTFFSQKPQLTVLIPFGLPVFPEKAHDQDIIWPQPPHEIITFLATRYLEISIQNALLQSLIAEQAARFIAMDSSTRNAGTMLDALKIDYNKLRQAKITRELTDLVGSFT